MRTPEQAEAVCDAIAATGALETARAEALEMVAEAKAELPALPDGAARRAASWWPTASSTATAGDAGR